MKRFGSFLFACLFSLLSVNAHAQMSIYYLHKESSEMRGVLQLSEALPDAKVTVLSSADMKGKKEGEYLIKAFITPQGTPNFNGVIPAGSRIAFVLAMKKTADAGEMQPLAKLYINGETGAPLCSATSPIPLATTDVQHVFHCATTSDFAMTSSDRFYLWVGVNLAASTGSSRVKASMNIEGNWGSQVIVGSPTITGLSPTSGQVGTPVTITGMSFGDSQGPSSVIFNGTTATISSWSATEIKTSVPVGVSLSTGPVEVNVAGLKSNKVSFTVPLPPGIITTVAGKGGISYCCDNLAACDAYLGSTEGVAVDAQGNLYIVGRNTNRVLRVNPDGIVTTLAGNGTQGYGGDGGPAGSAQLNNPDSVAADSAGNVFIADNWNHRIRKVSPDGTITTVAGTGVAGYGGDGGPATSAQISYPNGVAVDAGGNLYISEGYRIRKVDTNGIITTAAGTGVVGYCGDGGPAIEACINPRGLAIDSFGNIFINDHLNHRIRKVTPAGTISTLAGTGIAGYNGDGALATGLHLYYPSGVAVDARGNVYISDQYNRRVRKMDSAGIMKTIAGTGSYGFSGDGGMAASAQFSSPFGVAVDTQGNIFIADYGNNRIRKIGAKLIPLITSLQPSAGTTGSMLTIQGANFGANQVNSTVRLNGVPVQPIGWSDTTIIVVVPADAATGPVVVIVDGESSNSIDFSVTPQINNLSPNEGPIGAMVTFDGSGFGDVQGTSTVTFNGITAAPTGWSNSQIVVPVPSGATTGPVVMRVGSLVSNEVNFTVNLAPQIASLSPLAGYAGSSVTITGSNFGVTQGNSTVTFGGVMATPSSWTDTSVMVTVPAGASTGPVVVTVEGRASNGPIFTVLPLITSISPSSGVTGTVITITGANLGSAQGSSTVTFNGQKAYPTSWSDTTIVVPVPLMATTGPVVVTINGQAGNGVNFTVHPHIASLDPYSGKPGSTVNIWGSGFGMGHGNSSVTFNGVPAAPVMVENTVLWSPTSITVTVPADATTGPVIVTVEGVPSNGASFTVIPDVLEITYPLAGATVHTPHTMVMGRLPTVSGEVAVKVNDRLALVSGEGFAINGVDLLPGANTITAVMTDENGTTKATSITVYCSVDAGYVKLSATLETALAPMSTDLELETSQPSAIEDMTLSIDGPWTYNSTVEAFPVTLQLSAPGIYVATVTVRTIDGYTFEDKVAVNALDEVATEAQLRNKWNAMWDRLLAGDIDGAMAYFASTSQGRYRSIFAELQTQVPSVFGGIEGFHILWVRDNAAEAEAIRTESGEGYSYPVTFDRSETGFWKFKGL